MFTEQSGRVRVGPLDAVFAGARVWVLIGPTECPDSSGYLAVLSRLAEIGPAGRVGLRPSPHRRVWEFDSTVAPSAVLGDLDHGMSNVDAVLNTLVARPVAEPIEAANVRGYLAMSFDHGVGDAHAFAEIAAALTRAGAPLESGFIAPGPASTVHRPLSTVARRALASGPVALAGDIAYEIELIRARRRAADEDTPTQLATARISNYRTVFVRTEPGFLAGLRTLRDHRYPGASAASLIFYAIRSSLQHQGVPLTGTTSFLTDLRRHLRTGESTLANLSTVAEAVTPTGQSFGEFAAALSRATATSYPATRTLAACTAWMLRRPGRHRASVPAGARNNGVALTVSDVSRLPSLRKFRYRRLGDGDERQDRVIAVALPPGGGNHLTVALTSVAGELQVTATYYPDAVDADQLRSALTHGLTLDALSRC